MGICNMDYKCMQTFEHIWVQCEYAKQHCLKRVTNLLWTVES